MGIVFFVKWEECWFEKSILSSGVLACSLENMSSRWLSSRSLHGKDYDARFESLAEAGHDVHGEATFVQSYSPRRVLDAGCGTGRVALELAHRGIATLGTDLDERMLSAAREKAPEMQWVTADLATLDLRNTRGEQEKFDCIVMAGNVMIFLAQGSEQAVLSCLGAHTLPGGLLIAGFQLQADRLTLDAYDEFAEIAGYKIRERFSTWDRDIWHGSSGYAVSVHELLP